MRCFGLLLLLLLCPGRACAWETLVAEPITLLFHERDRAVAEKLLYEACAACRRVENALDLEASGPIRVMLPASGGEFQALTGGAIPDWGSACAFPAQATVVLRPQPWDKGRMIEILTHEMAHVLLGQALADNRPPRWFDEGVAMWLAREWHLSETLDMAWAVLTDSVIPLSQIDDVLTFSTPRAQRAYLESLLATTYLVQQAGVKAIPAIVRDMRGRGDPGKGGLQWSPGGGAGRPYDFDAALFGASGLTRSDFERLWLGYVERRFGPVALLSEDFNLWLLLCALVVVAYVVIKLRNRRIVRAWEEGREDEGEIGQGWHVVHRQDE